MSISPWSFSKLKAFEQCPKQFYHTKILHEYPTKESAAMRYGSEFHLAAEEYIRDGKPLLKKFSFAKAMLDALNAKRGEKLCELEMGLTENIEPCGFKAEDVWFRGIADLVILDGDLAWVIDYKTGKNSTYADKGQLELMALSIFAHYPQVTRVKAGLLFVVCKVLIKDNYTVDMRSKLLKKWLGKYMAMQVAAEKNVWNPRPSGLCLRHCPVVECTHNGAN